MCMLVSSVVQYNHDVPLKRERELMTSGQSPRGLGCGVNETGASRA